MASSGRSGAPARFTTTLPTTFVASFLGTPPMNLVEHDDGLLGFRPEHLLPREHARRRALVPSCPSQWIAVEYLGSERILYGASEASQAKREVIVSSGPRAASGIARRCMARLPRFAKPNCSILRPGHGLRVPARLSPQRRSWRDRSSAGPPAVRRA